MIAYHKYIIDNGTKQFRSIILFSWNLIPTNENLYKYVTVTLEYGFINSHAMTKIPRLITDMFAKTNSVTSLLLDIR